MIEPPKDSLQEWSQIEYGVVVNRTSDGLGYQLVYTSTDLHQAQVRAELQPAKYPVEINWRKVSRTPWGRLTRADAVLRA